MNRKMVKANPMEMKKRLLVGVAYATALTLAACSGSSPATGDNNTTVASTLASTNPSAAASTNEPIIVALPGEFETIEPHTYKSLPAFSVTGAVYAPLLKRSFDLNQEGELEYSMEVAPGLAELQEEESGTFTLTLREGAQFADGSTIDSDDLKYTFERALLGPGYVKGSLPLIGIEEPSQISVVDDRTVRFSPSIDSPLRDRILAFQTYTPLDAEVAAANATEEDEWAFDWYSQNATPNGAYVIDLLDPSREVVLNPNPNYYASPEVKNTGVTVQVIKDPDQRALLIQNGDIDVAEGLPPRLLAEADETEGLNVYAAPSTRVKFLGMNNTTPPFDDVRVRQAISHAIPYDALIEQAMYGFAEPAGNIVTSPMETYAGDEVGTYEYDLDRASELLEDAGIHELSLELSVRAADPSDQDAAVLIQESLRQIGIDLTITQMAEAQFAEALNAKTLDMFIHGWFSWGEDPIYQLLYLVESNAFTNWVGYSNPQVDKLIDEAMFETNPDRRAELSKEIQAILLEEAPMAYLYAPDYAVVYRDDIRGVGGLGFSEMLRFDQLARVP